MDKLNGKSLDIEKMNIEKLKELFPNAVTDGKINFEVLRNILGDEVDDSREKYQFTWNGKSKAIKLAQTPSSSTLRPCKEKSENWDSTENLYIEGDNLEVLKQLQKTYFGKIKMIYIDPPYNTGGDFVYKDDFRDSIANYKEITNQLSSSNPETSGRYHTDWLNMMYPRLILARNLLTNDGLIFISIDDNEQENVKKICEEIFGAQNFVATLKWKKKKQPSFLSKVADVMEYIHIYAKNYSSVKQLCVETLSDSDKPVVNASNNAVELVIKAGVRVKADVNFIKKGKYQNKTSITEYLDDVTIKDGRSCNDFRCVAKFRTDQESINKFVEDDLLFITKNLGLRRDLSDEEKGSGKAITDLLLDWGQNQDATDEVKKLFELNNDGSIFSNPKPSLLIKNLIKSNVKSDDIVLDFFSGSGTTAHSVFLFNAENNANVKFILVQLPELCSDDSIAKEMGYKTLCDIGEERIRRAAKKVKQDICLNDKDISLDFGFKVFQLDSTNLKPWDNSLIQNEENLLSLNEIFKEGRTKEDILYEIMLKYGIFDQIVSIENFNNKEFYKIGSEYMIVYLENEISSDIISKIIELRPKVVVFKENCFDNDNDKINSIHNLEKAGVEEIKCI